MMQYEWAHVSDFAGIVAPVDLAELAEDGNEAGDYGLAWNTGSNGCMVYGSLDELSELVTRMQESIRWARKAKRFQVIPCPECERTDDCECDPGINPRVL